MRWIIAWVAAALSFGVLDALWLSWAGPNLYRPALGEVLAVEFRMGPALLFYACYISAMVWFAVRPGLAQGVPHAVLNGALLGAIAYATYDLTNLATVKDWPILITVIDLAWGSAVSGVTALLSFLIIRRF